MKVPGVILGLLLPWLALAQQQYYGTRIADVTLSGTQFQNDLDSLSIHRGDILTVENLRSAIQALYDTGHYSYVEVEAVPAAGGTTSLTFRVKENYFFSTFRLEPDDLLERPLSSYVRLPVGEKFRMSVLDRVTKDTTDTLRNEGHFEATVEPEADFDDQNRLVSVRLRAMAGPRAKVGRVTIQGGEQTFSHDELLKALDMKPGSDFSTSKLDKGLSAIRVKFTNLSFLNTRVTANRNYDAERDTMDLDITVQPGQFALVDTRGYKISPKKLKDLVPIFEEGVVAKDLIDEGAE